MKTAIVVIGGEKFLSPDVKADIFITGENADINTGSMLTGEAIAAISADLLKKYGQVVFANSESGFSVGDIKSAILALQNSDVFIAKSEDGDAAVLATKTPLPEKLLEDTAFFTGYTFNVLVRKLKELKPAIAEAEALERAGV